VPLAAIHTPQVVIALAGGVAIRTHLTKQSPMARLPACNFEGAADPLSGRGAPPSPTGGRARDRASVRTAIFDRMSEADWAPFRKLAPDPWPKVQELLKSEA
jgi:hypothetical protein